MSGLATFEFRRFNRDPLTTVDYETDIDFVGDGIRAHRLDVIRPTGDPADGGPLPVYVYFHGGGWTSGDKGALTKYCASQAEGGMVVVNVNYRLATRLSLLTGFSMRHVLEDADAALAWVHANIAGYGGDPSRIVLGGDSAGGHISALYAAAVVDPALAQHHGLAPRLDRENLRGVVQHCSIVDFSVMFERGFILGFGFIRMLLPSRLTGLALRAAAHFLSPIEWVGSDYPPVFVTTSERDYFYRANLNFVARLRHHGVAVDTVIYPRASANTAHTWQQNAGFPESQEVYRRLRAFVRGVTSRPILAG
jgi:acetyl esterase